MRKLTAYAFLGGKKDIAASEFSFRPSVYAVIIKGENILVAKTKRTGRYALPGGGADYEDNLEVALKREVKEEVGIEIAIKEFLHFNENFFYYDPMNEAFDSYQYFFRCEALSAKLAKGDEVDDYEAGDPEWVPIPKITVENFQGVEMGILPILTRLLNEKNRD